MRFKNLVIIGTSHISRESQKAVELTIKKEKPAIVALELDRQRLAALAGGKRRRIGFREIRRIGLKGFLFAALCAWAERRLGKMVGTKPGSEMLKALSLCQKKNIPVALIDQDIETTLRNLSKRLSWKEKWQFLKDLFSTLFSRKDFGFDISKVPNEKIIESMNSELKRKYPNIHDVLVKDRNEYMAKRLVALMNSFKNGKVLAVVGAGHQKEILRIIKSHLNKKEKLSRRKR